MLPAGHPRTALGKVFFYRTDMVKTNIVDIVFIYHIWLNMTFFILVFCTYNAFALIMYVIHLDLIVVYIGFAF